MMAVIFIFLLPTLLSALEFATPDSKEEISKIIRFLTADVDHSNADFPHPGMTYLANAGELHGKKLPLSFFCTKNYWLYVLSLPGEDPFSEDLYNPANNSFTPMPGSRGQLQVERINIHSGINIYDAATWQIGLALAGRDHLEGEGGEDLFSLLENQTNLLNVGYDGNDIPEIEGQFHTDANRGVTFTPEHGKVFLYNGCEIKNPKEAYVFRALPQTYSNVDPLPESVLVTDASGRKIPTQDLPDNESSYPKICISWTDWKPITGENIWAFLLGPLHAALLKYKEEPCVPYQTLAVQNALAILGTFQKMQSKTGGIYYAPAGSISNMGGQQVSPYEVSVENNISALGGLLVFRRVLQDELNYGYSTAEDKQKIATALTTIRTMIYGGNYSVQRSDRDGSEQRRTRGLLSFLKNEAWNQREHQFYSGGEANKIDEHGEALAEWIPHEVRAVDVNTWGIALLGQKFLDEAHGLGTAYQLWQNVKSWGGFYAHPLDRRDQEIWGVGYSDHDHDSNGMIDPNDHSGILSGEWTAGAINGLRVLITQYTQYQDLQARAGETPENLEKIAFYISDLQKDHDYMVRHIQSLKTDHYENEVAFDTVRPPNYRSLIFIPADKLSYLYASKRYLIPFGWYANPIPSMASTTWALMLDYHFNPFSARGDYFPNDLSDPQEQAL